MYVKCIDCGRVGPEWEFDIVAIPKKPGRVIYEWVCAGYKGGCKGWKKEKIGRKKRNELF